ncbi:MAG: HlyD family efflux transporter periplasmic adaptor subunit [Hyphomicrobiales bacterium]|nr:MAG: HlyD family efflux transporter periplasmic adaptor subunit [Hyphomicrobiales bacterium]
MDHILAWLMGLLSLIPGIGSPPPQSWNGYAEADYVYAASATGGRIDQVLVHEGDAVAAGDLLFVLEARQLLAQLDAARAQTAAAEASLANLKSGARPEELDVTRASLAQAQATAALAQQNFERSKDLFNQGNVPRSQLDQAQASLDAAQAAVHQLEAQLKVAELPAREAQIAAAAANVAAAQASETAAQAALDNRTVTAPEAGRVERLFFSAGEVAGAGVPVLSVAGSDALKLKFYVGEADRSQFALGDIVSVSCDGCAAGLTATIDHFDTDPQFTPPIIYSRDERSRLVFLTEAVMVQQNGILPGQPVSIARIP